MKKSRKLALATIFVALVALFSGRALLAQSVAEKWSKNGVFKQDVVLKQGEKHEGSFYAAGQNVEIAGDINGSLYCGGQHVMVSGNITGDIICAGQNVTISGEIGGSARVAAQTISLENNVAGDVSVLAQNVAVRGKVAGDLNGAAQILNLRGEVHKNLRFAAEKINNSGVVRGVSDLSVANVDNSDGQFLGDVYYQSENDLGLKSVNGSVVYNPTPLGDEKGRSHKQLLRVKVAAKTSFAVMTIASVFAFALIIPRFMERSQKLVSKKPFKAILLGAAAVFGAPVLAITMMLTLVLLPLGLIVLLAWILLLALSGIFSAYSLGVAIMERFSSNVLVRAIIGGLVFAILTAVPFVGGFIWFGALIMGSGVIIQTLTHGFQKPSYVVENEKSLSPDKKNPSGS